MNSLVYKISQKVMHPAPLREFSFNALKREEATLERLIGQAREANQAAFRKIDDERKEKVLAAARKAREELGVVQLSMDQFTIVMDEALKNGPHITATHDYVVSKDLLELLSLRLALCRVGLSRKTFARGLRKD